MSVDKSDLIQLQSLDAAMAPGMLADYWPRLNRQLAHRRAWIGWRQSGCPLDSVTHLFCIDFNAGRPAAFAA